MKSLFTAILFTATAQACILGTAPGCSTIIADGLTKQLIAELNSMGFSFSPLSDPTKFVCNPPCVPSLQTSARDALARAATAAGDFITLNSAYRSSAQQYLLYKWVSAGLCYKIAATPGTSRHEGGLAIDVKYWNAWLNRLTSHGWKWYGAGDQWHFTYVGSDARLGVEKESLRAFQRLWNRNNPSDTISEDGIYGPNTAARLYRAPCGGW